jgi:hypothetical protein
MRTGALSKALYLVAMLLFVGIFAGCGGGDEQSGQGGQGDGADGGQGGAEQGDAEQGEAKGGQGEAARKDAPETKIALGRIVAVNPDKRVIVMRTNEEAQGGERMVFRTRKNTEITLDGEKADLEAVKKDQQVRIEYISKEKLDRAVSVSLFAVEQEPEGDGENEGGEGTG